MDKIAVIIITSEYEKQDRFIPGFEWEDAWRFDRNQKIAYRSANENEVKYVEEIEEINMDTLPVLIWLNTKKINNLGIDNILEKIYEKLTKRQDIYVCIKYHEPDYYSYIPQKFQNYASIYSLAKNYQVRFEKIITRDDKNKMYLKTFAPIKDILDCFLFNIPAFNVQEIIARIKHRINHLIGAVYLDLQALEEKSKESYQNYYYLWEKIHEIYSGENWENMFKAIKDSIESILIIMLGRKLSDFPELMNILESHKEAKDAVISLINNPLTNSRNNFYEDVRSRVNAFSNWINKLDLSLEEIIRKDDKRN